MSTQELREFMSLHAPSATGLAALGAALEARATGIPLDPALASHVDGLLAALGAGSALDGVTAEEAVPILAMLRLSLSLEKKLLFSHQRAMVWNHTEPEILQAGGDASMGFAQPLTRVVVPALEGLAQRLAAPGAAFLDIGVGVGQLAIAMARLWPELHIVGVNPWQPSLALARENIRSAGLEARITLREQAAEGLEDEGAFDLAWVPSTFVQGRVIRGVCERACRALRPGGWLLFPLASQAGDPKTAAVSRLRTALFGGFVASPPEVEGLLRDVGLVDVHELPTAPAAPITLVVGRRAP